MFDIEYVSDSLWFSKTGLTKPMGRVISYESSWAGLDTSLIVFTNRGCDLCWRRCNEVLNGLVLSLVALIMWSLLGLVDVVLNTHFSW